MQTRGRGALLPWPNLGGVWCVVHRNESGLKKFRHVSFKGTGEAKNGHIEDPKPKDKVIEAVEIQMKGQH